ncbi:MAG: hypothetical protein WDZ94_02850 [Patescibacteria group bacterium]
MKQESSETTSPAFQDQDVQNVREGRFAFGWLRFFRGQNNFANEQHFSGTHDSGEDDGDQTTTPQDVKAIIQQKLVELDAQISSGNFDSKTILEFSKVYGDYVQVRAGTLDVAAFLRTLDKQESTPEKM